MKLLARLPIADRPHILSVQSDVVEVYPAATLRCWTLWTLVLTP